MAEYTYTEGRYIFSFDDNSISTVPLEVYSKFVEKCREYIKEDQDNNGRRRRELVGSQTSK
jgi:hypothetical protein